MYLCIRDFKSNKSFCSEIDFFCTILFTNGCPVVVGKVMKETWKHDKQDRPTFTEVRGMLSTISV